MNKNKMEMISSGKVKPLNVILWLAWPVFLEQVLTTLVSYADTAMVGALGKYATASVSISNSPVFLINGVVMSLGIGITALIARNIGAKNYDKAKSLVRHAVLVVVFIGIPLCALILALSRQIPLWMGAEADIIDYATNYNFIVTLGRPFMMASMIFNSAFRGCGDTKTPLYINIGVNVLNVVGNFLLINETRVLTVFDYSFTMPGAGLGVSGAAIATAVSMTVGGIIATLLLFVRKNEMQISIKDNYKPDWVLTKQIFRISFPAMLERFCMSSAGILVSSSIATLGTAYVAANSLYLTAESMSFMPGFAFATATTTLVGQSLGAGKPKLAEKYTYYTVALAAIVLSVAGTLLYFFAGEILSFFTPDLEVIEIATHCLHLVAFLQPFQVTAWVIAGALRGAGDTKWTFYITAFTTWFIRTLGAVLVIRVFNGGLFEAIICMFTDGVVRMILLYLRFKTGKWKKIIRD